MYTGYVNENIFYEILRIYIKPTTLIFDLAAVFILIYTLKKKIVNKHMWVIFIFIIFGILAVLGYCGMMLQMLLGV
jgi:hypothetical protein